MKNNKTVYICLTHFHLLIAIIKSFREKSSIIITTNLDYRTLFDDTALIDRVKKSNCFEEVILIDDSDRQKKAKKVPFAYYVYQRHFARKNKKILKRFKEINIFLDTIPIGKALSFLHLNYTLIEDGVDSFKNPQFIPTNNIKTRIKAILGIYQLGQSPYIKRYEVNNISIVPSFIDKDKIIEKPKKKLFNTLSKTEKERILDIFGIQLKEMQDWYDVLLLTQPLEKSFSGITEEKKVALYRKILSDYNGKRIIIKTHPREETDYSKLFPNCDVVKEKFPVELLNFLPYKFDSIVAISSTSAFYNAKKTVYLGWDWLDMETGGAVYGKE